MATIRRLFSTETVEDLEKENVVLEEKSLEHTKSIVEMEKKDTEIVNELESIWALDGKENASKRKELTKQHESMQTKIRKEDGVRNMIDTQISVNGSIIHEKREHADWADRLKSILPKLYKIKRAITAKNADETRNKLNEMARDDDNMIVPDGKRYDKEYLESIGIGGASKRKTRKSTKKTRKTQKSRQ